MEGEVCRDGFVSIKLLDQTHEISVLFSSCLHSVSSIVIGDLSAVTQVFVDILGYSPADVIPEEDVIYRFKHALALDVFPLFVKGLRVEGSVLSYLSE